MLLRRITHHIKNQNWFAVFLDFIIVVAGVFIGIQVSNWNESRVEAIREQEVLVSIRWKCTKGCQGPILPVGG